MPSPCITPTRADARGRPYIISYSVSAAPSALYRGRGESVYDVIIHLSDVCDQMFDALVHVYEGVKQNLSLISAAQGYSTTTRRESLLVRVLSHCCICVRSLGDSGAVVRSSASVMVRILRLSLVCACCISAKPTDDTVG